MLFVESVKPSFHFPCKPTISRQIGRSNLFTTTKPSARSSFLPKRRSPHTHLTTRMMSQIPPIHFKPTMIKRMHQLVRQRILHMLLIEEPVLA